MALKTKHVMEEKANVVININGGNNQILPNATKAVQNFYGDKLEEDYLAKSQAEEESEAIPQLSDAERRMSIYINKVELRQQYVDRLAQCTSAADIGKVVVDMRKDPDVRVDKEEAAKARFINVLLAFAPNVESGRTVSNVRQRIDAAWANRNK